MPTFDGGHYFLTVLVPVETKPIPSGSAWTSPAHALRKQLAMLPTAAQSPACGGGQSPFAQNTRNHFVRFAIIDDVAYNGRQQSPLLWTLIKKIDIMVAQPQDHLTCPFLFFGAEFDAANGTNDERDSYLAALWDTMQTQLKEIFKFCVGFDQNVNDAASFAKYIARGQIETTMSFNAYYPDNSDDIIKSLPAWPYDKILIPAGFGGILFLLGFVVWFFFCGGFMLLFVGAAVLAAGLYLAYATVMKAGAKPFPPAADLPTVLKSLHLQRAFTRFAIDNQLLVADPSSAEQLRAAFRDFVAENQPDNLLRPTQPPGIIGI